MTDTTGYVPDDDGYRRAIADALDVLAGRTPTRYPDDYAHVDPDDDDTMRETATSALDELPLDVERLYAFRVILATGGPHEELRITTRENGYVLDIVRAHMWGTDHYAVDVSHDDVWREYAERLAELMTEATYVPDPWSDR